jgi:hypothetical protein
MTHPTEYDTTDDRDENTAPYDPSTVDEAARWPAGSSAGAATPAELTAGLGRAFTLIGTVTGQVDAILDELQARRPGGGIAPIRWAELDAETADRTWADLYEWVTWLLDRYAIREIPRACWWKHGLIVEELTALWLAWQGAYAPDATSAAPLIWHQHLDHTRDRIRLRLGAQGNCVTAGHQPPVLQPHGPEIRADFANFRRADTEQRAQTDPPPNGLVPNRTS